jgi:hypothetical protein
LTAESPPCGTTYARGSSVACSSTYTPMTAQSATLGWMRRTASSSAGATAGQQERGAGEEVRGGGSAIRSGVIPIRFVADDD